MSSQKKGLYSRHFLSGYLYLSPSVKHCCTRQLKSLTQLSSNFIVDICTRLVLKSYICCIRLSPSCLHLHLTYNEAALLDSLLIRLHSHCQDLSLLLQTKCLLLCQKTILLLLVVTILPNSRPLPQAHGRSSVIWRYFKKVEDNKGECAVCLVPKATPEGVCGQRKSM